MARSISAAQAQAQMRAAAQKLQREVDRVNRENKRRVEEYNREVNRVNQHNAQVARLNARVNAQLQQTNAHNQQVAAQAGRTVYEISRQLRSAGRTTRVVYTPAEQALTERVQHDLAGRDDRERLRRRHRREDRGRGDAGPKGLSQLRFGPAHI